MRILGISAYYHDAAACLVVNGKVIAAVQEERFTRIRHDSSFPANSVQYCLKYANLAPCDIDYVVFYDKPILKFDRLLETYLAFAPRGFDAFSKSLPVWLKDKLFQKKTILENLKKSLGDGSWEKKLFFSEHHLSHAASAFYPSPFENAAVLTLDGVGEWATTSLSVGRGKALSIQKEINFPHSLGLLYSAMTYYLGFKVNSGEYKVMGLAPYGEPKYADLIKDHLIDIKEDGSYALNVSYFDFPAGLKMTNQKFDNLFGAPPRNPESEITQRDMDLAASVQIVLEDVLIKLAKGVLRDTGDKNLCLAGGVALNCVANGRLLEHKIFENVWIQPAAGDSGGAIGAALAFYHLGLNQERVKFENCVDGMSGAYLGPSYSSGEVVNILEKCGAKFVEYSYDDALDYAAKSLSEGKAVGWMTGRMEFGPRSLGGRSILADPRSPTMQKQLNLKVKFRESFRPFAPSVLREYVNDWFDLDLDSPYMLIVANVKKEKCKNLTSANHLFGIDKLNVSRSEIPAVTHIDYSARVQTVDEATNPQYYKLIKKFYEITGCPVLVNTSFNVRGEPIVMSPEDAFKCFMGTDLDTLVIENIVLEKANQDVSLLSDYRNKYDLD